MKKMISKGKRMVALFLCCAVCVLTFGNTSFAACNHSWRYESVPQRGYYINNTKCKIWYIDYRICNYCECREVASNPKEYIKIGSHTPGGPSGATCNGKIQTIYSTCTICKHHISTTRVCPAGPHANGSCPALPASVKPVVK